jgi:hypothetical protein
MTHTPPRAALDMQQVMHAPCDSTRARCAAAGGGLVFWHPNGAMVRHLIETYWKELHLQRGYQLVYSPHIAKVDLWKTSGHWDFYKENMYDQMQVRGGLARPGWAGWGTRVAACSDRYNACCCSRVDQKHGGCAAAVQPWCHTGTTGSELEPMSQSTWQAAAAELA